MTENTNNGNESTGGPSAFSAGLGSTQPEQREWELGDYDNGESGCPKCGRFRLCLCPNGKHRCEKCNWSPELNDYAPVDY